MDIDLYGAIAAGDLGGVTGETGHAVHLERRVARIAREHLVRDDRCLHYADRTTSSVTSGLAKSRNGTNVVPRPGETCRRVGPYA